MTEKIIRVRTDHQPPAGVEYSAASYPEPGAYLIDWCGSEHVALISMHGSVVMQSAANFVFESPPVEPPKPEKAPQLPMVREEFALQLLATALEPTRRATP